MNFHVIDPQYTGIISGKSFEMIGRLGISSALGGQSTSSSSAGTSRGSITSTTGSMMNMGAPSMPSLSGFSTGFTNMTKKVTETLAASTTDGEKKTKDDTRKLQIAQAVQIMEDVSLQSPSTHLGLVLAYTSRNSSPVIHPGLKFTWFRMRGQDHIDQVEESQRAWYAPSVDDIGCTICVQCEDNFDQGLSRYLEVILLTILLFFDIYHLRLVANDLASPRNDNF